MDKDQVAAHFRDKADIWVRTSHEGDLNHYPTADHRKRVVRRLLAKSSSSSQVLDLGCGAGHLAIALAEDGHNVTGIDQSTRMIELARERAWQTHRKLSVTVSASMRAISKIWIFPPTRSTS